MNRILGWTLVALVMSGAATAQSTAGAAPAVSEAPALLQPPQISPAEKARNEAAYEAYLKAPDTEGTGPYPAMKEEDPACLTMSCTGRRISIKLERGSLGSSGGETAPARQTALERASS